MVNIKSPNPSEHRNISCRGIFADKGPKITISTLFVVLSYTWNYRNIATNHGYR